MGPGAAACGDEALHPRPRRQRQRQANLAAVKLELTEFFQAAVTEIAQATVLAVRTELAVLLRNDMGGVATPATEPHDNYFDVDLDYIGIAFDVDAKNEILMDAKASCSSGTTKAYLPPEVEAPATMDNVKAKIQQQAAAPSSRPSRARSSLLVPKAHGATANFEASGALDHVMTSADVEASHTIDAKDSQQWLNASSKQRRVRIACTSTPGSPSASRLQPLQKRPRAAATDMQSRIRGVLRASCDNDGLTIRDIASSVQGNQRDILRCLQAMQDAGLIYQTLNAGRYALLELTSSDDDF